MEEVSYHSGALSSYAWDLNYYGIEQYLGQAVKINRYQMASYFDDATQDVEVRVYGSGLNGYEHMLVSLHIMNELEMESPVRNGEETLGTLVIVLVNRVFYNYCYAFLVYILVQVVLYLIIQLLYARNWLNLRVKKRTEELEQEILFRQKAEKDLRLTLESIGDGVIRTNLENNIVWMNPVAQKLTGWTIEQADGKLLTEVYKIKEIVEEEGGIDNPVSILVSGDSGEFRVSETRSAVLTPQGLKNGDVIVFRDITEAHKLQLQLEHSQRMNVIGKLAGGVAHDFNNVLGGILGSSELLQNYLNGDPNGIRLNEMIIATTERAAGLTRQLLMLSRKQKIAFMDMDFHRILNDTVSLLGRTLDPRIKIRLETNASHPVIVGDQAMIQNLLINLGVNASHAMPGGGILTLKTDNLNILERYSSMSDVTLPQGKYLVCHVEDTGCGIPKDVLPRIFEPFFTTKEEGKGTGLGLASVFGTVQQHHGVIRVYSEENVGTSFHIYLPLSAEQSLLYPDAEEQSLDGNENILVSDDDQLIRYWVKSLLEERGYNVLTAANGEDALKIFRENQDHLDMAVLDMIMPVMSGRECFEQIRQLSPDFPVLLTTGLSELEDLQILKESKNTLFLSKPYNSRELGLKIKDLLKE